jgi:hypothetical protein
MAAAIGVTLMRRVMATMIRYLGTIGEVLTLANGLAARGHTGVHGAEKQDRAAS